MDNIFLVLIVLIIVAIILLASSSSSSKKSSSQPVGSQNLTVSNPTLTLGVPSSPINQNKSQQCLVNKSRFNAKAQELQSFRLADLKKPDKVSSLREFCYLGSNILSCSPDLHYPLTNAQYVTYCCNGSYDGKLDLKALEDAVNFYTAEEKLKYIELPDVQSNLTSILDFCKLGTSLFKDYSEAPSGHPYIPMIQEANPMMSGTYKKLCCNGSTNANDCTVENTQCLLNLQNFMESAKILQNSSQINEELASNFCTLGTSLIENCHQETPYKLQIYKQLCT
jgi:hypothetical protein